MAMPVIKKYLLAGPALFCLFLAVLIFTQPQQVSANGQVTEYHVKAVFLYNLTRFVSWPKDTRAENMDFLIGIYGNDPFGEILDKAVANEHRDGKSIKVVRYSSMQELKKTTCNILFISASVIDSFTESKSFFEGRPILTVADTPGFPESGGMVNLIEENQKIGVEINRLAARKAGLFISSKLLRLARIVE